MSLRFRKKPVAIEAFQMTPERILPHGLPGKDFPKWLFSAMFQAPEILGSVYATEAGELKIHTLEGHMRVSPGDWIIRGVHGELYPCKPNFFAETYEPVDPE